MELFQLGPLTDETAPVHVQRAWYVALGTATVMLLGGLFTASFNLMMGGIIVVGLGHGMVQGSWVSAAALLAYLVGILTQAGWVHRQPVLVVLALAVGYFLAQGVRATWWQRGRGELASRTGVV